MHRERHGLKIQSVSQCESGAVYQYDDQPLSNNETESAESLPNEDPLSRTLPSLSNYLSRQAPVRIQL